MPKSSSLTVTSSPVWRSGGLGPVGPQRSTREEQVRGLDVAMDDARVVSAPEADARLRRDAERDVLRERSMPDHELLEILPVKELHDEVRVLGDGIAPAVEHERDVLALDRA